jgi:hypothetical protein
MTMTPPKQDHNAEPQDEEIVNTSGADATEDSGSPADPGTDELSTGTNIGETTSDRATGLTAFN